MVWKGNDYGSGLIQTFSKDENIKKLAERLGGVEIKSQSMDHGFQGWTIDIKGKFSHPTFEDWESLK